MEALQYLKDKYGSNDNSLYFREPDLPLSTSLERICKYMQEYAESHTAAHTDALRNQITDLERENAHIREVYDSIERHRNELRERVKELEEGYKVIAKAWKYDTTAEALRTYAEVVRMEVKKALK